VHIQDLAGKNIRILGYGKEGRAMAAAIEAATPGASITICDRDPAIRADFKHHRLCTGEGWLKNLGMFDVLIKSPGIPPQPELETLRAKLTSPTQIFLDSIRNSGATVVGITGSKGKSTTSSLIYEMLKADGSHPVFLIGNIGDPAIAHLNHAQKNTIFVQEMSSYQLMDLTSGPHIAVITSLFPEHLDYHGSMEDYLEAKSHISSMQTKNDIVFFNAESAHAKIIALKSPGKTVACGAGDAPVKLEEIALKGKHNLSNIALAYSVVTHLGVPKEISLKTIRQFRGLPHRLETVGIEQGMEWVNDSISTTPESAIAALDALGERVQTVILGGQDRGYDFTPLAEKLTKSNVHTVILLPDSGETIGRAIGKAHANIRCYCAATMNEAVALAREHTKAGTDVPIVLLSPASPSYGHFKNFEDRGNQFKSAALGR
jgi:UDP-N-acetylmuramoylalanine--D-glutamate ligase